MSLPFFTIGHSTRRLDEFVALLQESGVRQVIDIRKMPMSKTNPQFNASAMEGGLAAFQIGYGRIEALGGLRGKAQGVPAETNGLWRNRSFHNYADHMLTPEYRAGLDRLVAMGREQRCAIMCSEAVWWRCHRRLIADSLIARGESVFHIMGRGRVDNARLTEAARIRADTTVIYPSRPDHSSGR